MGRFFAAARGNPALIILRGTALERANHLSDHDYTPRGSEGTGHLISYFVFQGPHRAVLQVSVMVVSVIDLTFLLVNDCRSFPAGLLDHPTTIAALHKVRLLSPLRKHIFSRWAGDKLHQLSLLLNNIIWYGTGHESDYLPHPAKLYLGFWNRLTNLEQLWAHLHSNLVVAHGAIPPTNGNNVTYTVAVNADQPSSTTVTPFAEPSFAGLTTLLLD